MDLRPYPPAGDDVDDELCAMFDESSQCTIVLPEECLSLALSLGYGLVVPFLAYRFASLVSHYIKTGWAKFL